VAAAAVVVVSDRKAEGEHDHLKTAMLVARGQKAAVGREQQVLEIVAMTVLLDLLSRALVRPSLQTML
jgi:hypothetical protein